MGEQVPGDIRVLERIAGAATFHARREEIVKVLGIAGKKRIVPDE